MSLIIPLLLSLILVTAVAASGARFRPDAWYEALRKPPGLPPKWIFPVVWTLLYVMMAIAAALIWVQPESPVRSIGLIFYAIQLVANAAWSWLFFGRRRMDLALVDLALLIALVSLTTSYFLKLSTLAGGLLLPYLIWLLIALYLNSSVWWLNAASKTNHKT